LKGSNRPINYYLVGTRKKSRRVNETQTTAERVECIEQSLPPRHRFNLSEIPTAGLLNPVSDRHQVRYGKVEILILMVRPPLTNVIAVGYRIVASQDYAITIKIMPPRRYALSVVLKHVTIEFGSEIDIRYREYYAIEMRYGHVRFSFR
jgi:hypothetical protein